MKRQLNTQIKNAKKVISMKILLLLRGLPGSGKSTFAKFLEESNPAYVRLETDMFWNILGPEEYAFDASRLGEAHSWCQSKVDYAMSHGLPVIVSNTFTTERELKPYYEMANKYGYTVYSLVVENRHGGKNIHNVPEATLDKMENRFSLKLR